MPVQVRRVYDAPDPEDGARLLVDRLWPRGVAKEAAHVDEWLKDVAPSGELRTWYGHDPAKFDAFRDRYLTELDDPARRRALDRIAELAREGPVTLLTATRDAGRSHAAVLAGLLGEARSGAKAPR
ncbi:DUF488 family protein [Sphaerisporangium sp. NPDC005289]|uniref:DUF488 domain-containing protein n=1 Tax=Sphaerisporangium sp. NPDC005289 TaxID=3155247 RepID=UPI0033B005F2